MGQYSRTKPRPALSAAKLSPEPVPNKAELPGVAIDLLRLQRQLGNARVTRALNRSGSALLQRDRGRRPAEPHPVTTEMNSAMDEIQHVVLDIDTVRSVLLPAYRRAVDALDPQGALQLAMAIGEGLRRIEAGSSTARELTTQADPYATQVSRPPVTDEPVSLPEPLPAPAPTQGMASAYGDLGGELTMVETQRTQLYSDLAQQIGPQLFRGEPIAGSLQPPTEQIDPDVIVNEAGTVVEILFTVQEIRNLTAGGPSEAELDDDMDADTDGMEFNESAQQRAAQLISDWRSRPANFRFLQAILMREGLWAPLQKTTDRNGRTLSEVSEQVSEQALVTGNLGDVGTFDADRVEDLLSRGITDWAVTDENAMDVFAMIKGAAPQTRAGLIKQIHGMGRLGALCENLPWRYVEAMHGAVDDPEAQGLLRPYFVGKGGGQSLSQVYEETIMDHLEEGNNVRAFGYTYLKTAHNALTFGFLDAHDAAYEAEQEGLISSDAYLSTATKAVGRSAAIAGVTALTGGAAGAWGEGVALGLNAGKTTAQLIGAGFGGATSGVAGQLTTDLYDLALMDGTGFSSPGTYLEAGALGAATGTLLGGVQAAGSRYLPQSAKTMSQSYAERYPQLDNLLTRIRNSGVRSGLRMQVTAQELAALMDSGLVNRAQALERIRAVYGNDRVNIDEPLSRVYPQSEIEQQFGTVDPATGEVTVANANPTAGGYAGVSDQLPPGARSNDTGVRDALGIDGPINWYDKYKNPADPLFEVQFKTSVELDVPLPADNARATGHSTLGMQDPQSQHMPGTGVTAGGVQEGILPRGTPIEIVDIRPVGTPRPGYPSTGATYSPYSPATPSVRNLQAPVSGAVSGSVSESELICSPEDEQHSSQPEEEQSLP